VYPAKQVHTVSGIAAVVATEKVLVGHAVHALAKGYSPALQAMQDSFHGPVPIPAALYLPLGQGKHQFKPFDISPL
jgi:hypothetical protein